MKTKQSETLPVKTSLINLEQPLPFERFYLSFVQAGRCQLHDALSAAQIKLLTEESHRALERNLLERLVGVGTEVLLYEFDRLRPEQIAAIDSADCTLYNNFMDGLLDGRIALFQDYPVLEDLIKIIINQWVKSTTDFVERLAADVSKLAETFGGVRSLGQVQTIVTNLSNRHTSDRSILMLTFTSGVELVYRPQDLALDKAFQELLHWCNQQNISLPFQQVKILSGEGYGWQELIKQQACETRSQVQHFYQRAGMLSALLWVLGTKDCEHDHVVAAGEHPLLINAAALMSPAFFETEEEHRWFHDSVIKTGILPRWSGQLEARNTWDTSVLGNILPKQNGAAQEWKFINTDRMNLVRASVVVPAGKNAVILDGETVSPKDYTDEIKAGFAEIYRLLIKNRASLIGLNSPLASFAQLTFGCCLRPRHAYHTIFRQSLKPDYLRDSDDYLSLISYLIKERAPSYWPLASHPAAEQIFAAEIVALQRQDFPCFTVTGNQDSLMIDQNISINHFFATASYQQMIDRLQQIDEADLTRQLQLISSSSIAKFAHLKQLDTALQGHFPLGNSLSPAEFQSAAFQIGQEMVESAIWVGDGCNWRSIEYMYAANRYQLSILNDSLFTGRAGVSLFLAALAKISGDDQFRRTALAALHPFRSLMRAGKIPPELAKAEIGLLGLGGIIYSMVKVSQFLAEPTLLPDALQAAKLISPAIIAADRKLDVVFGSTGALLGLLQLYQATQDAAVLDIAINCGQHLVANRTAISPRAWLMHEGESSRPLTGFSHGAAGMSFALLRLYAATGNEEFLAAAEEGMAYERDVFDQTAQNWPHFGAFSPGSEVVCWNTWCHGSPGIGLGRLGSLPMLPLSEVQAEVDIALRTSQKNGISDGWLDHLCCGNMGRVELLVVASQKLQDDRLLRAARQHGTKVVKAAIQNGSYGLQSHLSDNVHSPSFYKGAAGVGYQLLRLVNPNFMPSVPLWE
jgi:type 2 lantibiotic biosynthesis protein LanM